MNSAALRTLLIYAVVLPLAVFIGWTAVDLADWDRTSFATFVAILFVLLLPILLKWHYPAMLFSWNTGITIFFLPGTPGLWMLLAGMNFGIAVLNLRAPSVLLGFRLGGIVGYKFLSQYRVAINLEKSVVQLQRRIHPTRAAANN